MHSFLIDNLIQTKQYMAYPPSQAGSTSSVGLVALPPVGKPGPADIPQGPKQGANYCYYSF